MPGNSCPTEGRKEGVRLSNESCGESFCNLQFDKHFSRLPQSHQDYNLIPDQPMGSAVLQDRNWTAVIPALQQLSGFQRGKIICNS